MDLKRDLNNIGLLYFFIAIILIFVFANSVGAQSSWDDYDIVDCCTYANQQYHSEYITVYKMNSPLKLGLGIIHLEDGTSIQFTKDELEGIYRFRGFKTSVATCVRFDINNTGASKIASCEFGWYKIQQPTPTSMPVPTPTLVPPVYIEMHYIPVITRCYPFPEFLGCAFPPVP